MGSIGQGHGVCELQDRDPVGQPERRLETVGEARFEPVADGDPVDHHIDIVFQFLVELGRLLELVIVAVDLGALIALAQKIRQFLAVFAFPIPNHRRQDIGAGPLGKRCDLIDHLADLHRLDRQPRRRGIGDADPRPQKTHIIVDFGDCADGGAGIAAGGFLLDRNRRRQPLDRVHIGLLHEFKKLPRIGGKALHIAPLPFGVDRIEGQG